MANQPAAANRPRGTSISVAEEQKKDEVASNPGKLKVPRQLWQQRMDQIVPSGNLMDELVMNFLIHEGYKEGALCFAQESGIRAQIDTESIDARIMIKRLILAGDIEEAIRQINEVNPEVSLIIFQKV